LPKQRQGERGSARAEAGQSQEPRGMPIAPASVHAAFMPATCAWHCRAAQPLARLGVALCLCARQGPPPHDGLPHQGTRRRVRLWSWPRPT
jgi:hypothetical protein